jgi:hypothetical protein
VSTDGLSASAICLAQGALTQGLPVAVTVTLLGGSSIRASLLWVALSETSIGCSLPLGVFTGHV